MAKILTKNMFINKSCAIHDNFYSYELVEFKNAHDYIKIICPKHGEYTQQVHVHLGGSGCPKCGEQLTGIKLRKDTKYFIEKAIAIHENKYDYSEVNYVTSHGYVNIICPLHGNFSQTANSHLNGNGCPYCKESIGEKKIAKYLSNNLIKFEREKKFNDCENINKLVFDFFLPNHNVLIEFDGEQHFSVVNHFGGIGKLEKQIINDNIKNDYAKSNNYHLLRIRFDQINEISEILETYEPISQR